MSAADRKASRRAKNSQINTTSKLYKQALKEGARMEQHFKNTLNGLPWLQRQIIGYKVMRGTWK